MFWVYIIFQKAFQFTSHIQIKIILTMIIIVEAAHDKEALKEPHINC